MSSRVIWPTYSVAGWTANADDDSGCRWVVTDSTLTSGPKRKTHITERPFGAGAYRARSYPTARYDTLGGWCQAPDRAGAEAARDQFLSTFPDGDQVVLVKDSGISQRQLTVELDAAEPKIEFWEDAQGFDWQLALCAIDPRWLGIAVQSATTTVGGPSTDGLDWNVSPGGLDWNVSPGGLDWGAGGSSGVLALANAGTFTTWPVYTITGPITNPSFTDPSTGDVVAYTGFIDVGQTLVIDSSPFSRSVRLNGIDRFGLLASAQWIEIPAGGQVNVQFGGSGTGSVVATWQNAYK